MLERKDLYIPETKKLLQEKCGIVGLYLPSTDRKTQIAIAINSIIGLWHRGQQGAGITIKDNDGLKTHHGDGLPEQAFPADIVNAFGEGENPSWIIGQTRYGTFGNWNKANLQPVIQRSSDNEPLTVAHNGQFTAIERMKNNITEPVLDDASDTYIFSKLLAKAEGNTWDEKIISTLDKATTGAYSLVIGVGKSLYLARDPQGIRPLVLGKIGDGFMAASETHALDKVGASVIRKIKRGEIVRIDKEGVITIKEGLDGDGNFCDFEWDYFSRPDSSYPFSWEDLENPEKWKSLYEFRDQCGAVLAKESPILNASFVIGVPDSGVPVSIGYANALDVPYKQLILRDHYDPNGNERLFQADYDKTKIGQRVIGKLSLVPNNRIWKDAIVVLGDDSCVRGDSSNALTKAVFNAGAKEVHWIFGFPQVMHPCYLGVSMRTHGELIAFRNQGDPKKIAREIGATSVNYISHEGFIQARLRSGADLFIPEDRNEIFLANGGCGGCLTGRYPVSQEGIHYKKIEKTC